MLLNNIKQGVVVVQGGSGVDEGPESIPLNVSSPPQLSFSRITVRGGG